jgi:hypothetical protein
MPHHEWIEPIVEKTVNQVVENYAAQMRVEIVQRVMEQVAAQAEEPAAAAVSVASILARAISDIQASSSQKEILRALLDSCASCAARTALFVVKGGQVAGWQARGFSNGDAIKDFALDTTCPAVARALVDRFAGTAAGFEFDASFFEEFGAPGGEGRLLPLILKDKVAALVYVDGGPHDAACDFGAIEVLVYSASAWLEVNALRKQAHKDLAHAEHHETPVHEPAYNDPFAAHAPAYAAAEAASEAPMEAVAEAMPAPAMQPAYEVQPAPAMQSDWHATAASATGEGQATAVAEQETVAVPWPTSPVEMRITETTAQPEPVPAISPEDQMLHTKAQRFARLLVDEIKLYNQSKVAEGRMHRDLYDRLRDPIEKSQATYQKRYGSTVAASGNYFQHELIRSLAEDDILLMGPNFHM